MYVRYNIYLWTPPKLTAQEEIQIGRQIVLEGRDVFLQKAPYLSENEQRYIESAKHRTPTQWVILWVIALGVAIPVLIVAWIPFLIVLVPVLIFSGTSLLHARARYRNWVDEMIGKYAAYVAKGHEIDAKNTFQTR